METSSFLHSPFFSTSSSSQCSMQPPFLLQSPTNLLARRNNKGTMACMKKQIPNGTKLYRRRLIQLMGFSAIPFLTTRADPLQAETSQLSPQDHKQETEQSTQGNPFFSLLNALGFLGSGVLAALYALALQEKTTSDATIESMSIKLKEKEAAITSLKKKNESDLLNEKEISEKALAKADAQQLSLLNHLKVANDTVKDLGKELQKEKISVEDLTAQVDSLEARIRKSGDEKTELQEELKDKLYSIAALQERVDLLSSDIKDKVENIQYINSKFAEKEKEFDKLSSVYHESQYQITELNSEMEQLEVVILKNEKELELKNEKVCNLNEELASLLAERDEFSKKLDATVEEYNHFKTIAEEKAASDAKNLQERDEKINKLEEQLKFAIDEVNKTKVFVADLTKEKDNLRGILDVELKNVKNLEQELKSVSELLEKSRDKTSDLEKQLQKSRQLSSSLEAEVAKVRIEFTEVKESLQSNLNEAKASEDILCKELKSKKELLSKSNEELQIKSQELASAILKSDSLEKELVDARKKTEIAANDLQEEKKIISALQKELKALETQISKDREARKSLETDLEEATKSLDEMNGNALLLSRELELYNTQISSLEYEKDALYMSLDEQKRVSQEARENLEDAHNLVMRLGKERESLETRGKKLEEELGSAKGEILRLRSQINSSKSVVNDDKKDEVKEVVAVPAKKVTRRRKVNPPQQQDL